MKSTGLGGGRRTERGLGLGHRVEDPPRVREEHLTAGQEGDAAGPPREQGRAQLVLEGPDLAGERRLADVEPPRGPVMLASSATATKYRI